MPITNRKVVILRAGIVTEASIRAGAESVDTIDKVYNLSVQATAGTAKQDTPTITMLRAAVPNPHYALTFAGSIMDKGGTIEYAPIVPGNPRHALVSNITVEDLYEIFKINKH
jgi:hypothetical protein